MKRLLTILALFNHAFAANYYVDSREGSNSNTGTIGSPWATISKVSATVLQAGDSVFLRAGQVFTDQLYMNGSGAAGKPIYFGRYGVGANPKISGFATLAGWRPVGTSGIYEATDVSLGATVSVLTIDGRIYGKGRLPRSGWSSFERFTGRSSITDLQLQPTPSLAGGELVIRPRQWYYEKKTITGHEGNTLTYAGSLLYDPFANYGYFVQNVPAALTTFGDWMYDAGTKTVRIYFGVGSDPSRYAVKVSRLVTGIRYNTTRYNIVQSIDVEGCEDGGASGQNGGNNELRNCNFSAIGRYGLRFFTVRDMVVDGCTFTDMQSNGIDAQSGCAQWRVTNNSFRRIGVTPGAGGGGENHHNAVFIAGDSSFIAYNTIDSVGYNGIYARDNGWTIQNNFINHHNFVLQDGGGIYTYAGGSAGSTPGFTRRIIRNNVVLNGIGAAAGTAESENKAMNYYLDDKSSDILFEGNVSAHGGGHGLFLHNASRVTILRNTFFDHALGAIKVRTYDVAGPTRQLRIDSNVLIARPGQYLLNIDSDETSIFGWGTASANRYLVPGSGTGAFVTNTTPRAFETWRQVSGKDVRSSLATVAEVRLEVNATRKSVTRDLGRTDYVDPAGKPYPRTVTLKPFSTIVVMR